MNRQQYNAARAAAYQAERDAERMFSEVVYGYYGEAMRASEYAAELRAALRPPTNWYWRTRNAREASIQQRCIDAVRAKRHADHVKRELPKLIPTGNKVEDAMRQVAVSFGGLTAERAMRASA